MVVVCPAIEMMLESPRAVSGGGAGPGGQVSRESPTESFDLEP